jgi:hypothetical protein
VEDTNWKLVEGTRKECQGPQFVMEFSGSEGRLIYKTTHKYRQTRTADKCGQKNIREANMNINRSRLVENVENSLRCSAGEGEFGPLSQLVEPSSDSCTHRSFRQMILFTNVVTKAFELLYVGVTV